MKRLAEDTINLGVYGPKGEQLVYLVEEQPNPSTDFFALPAVLQNKPRVLRCGFNDLPSGSGLTGAVVIFVRYVPPAWAKLVEQEHRRLRRVVFFMDDDVLDVAASSGLPWRYRYKLAKLAAWRSGWLRRRNAELWVSTPYLYRKYSDWRPKLVLPSPAAFPPNFRRVFYHGSSSHQAEIRWLRPVLEEVLRRNDQLSFEIIGGSSVYRLYRGLPRVTVVHPMKWPAYQAFLSNPGRHVGLAPQIDSPFNRARSYTKFFDITRCGAVGIYSSKSPCAEVVRDGTDGLVADLEQGAWVESILTLIRDESLRGKLLLNAEARMVELAETAKKSYPDFPEAGSD